MKKVYYCRLFDISKASVQSSGFHTAGQARRIHRQNHCALSESSFNDDVIIPHIGCFCSLGGDGRVRARWRHLRNDIAKDFDHFHHLKSRRLYWKVYERQYVLYQSRSANFQCYSTSTLSMLNKLH